MGFGQSVKTNFGKYATFSGRASRPEFWWFQLFCIIITGFPMLLGMFFIIAGAASNADTIETTGSFGILGLFGVLFIVIGFLAAIVTFIPTLAVGCRRLHDRGTSGWLQLLMLVPFGNIVLLVFWVLSGTEGDNTYGPKPTNA